MFKAFYIFILLLLPINSYAKTIVHQLDCGRILIKDLSVFDKNEQKNKTLQMQNYCYLIEHNKQYIMWDTGLPDSWIDVDIGITSKWSGQGPFELFVDKTLSSQLNKLGINYADIEYVGFSHLHFNQTGNANKFKHATWLVQKNEYLSAIKLAGQGSMYRLVRFKDLLKSKHKLLEKNYDVFGDGALQIIPAPGHSAGHQVMLVKTDTGNILLAGNAAINNEYWKNKNFNLLSQNPVLANQTAEQLQKIITDNNAIILFAN